MVNRACWAPQKRGLNKWPVALCQAGPLSEQSSQVAGAEQQREIHKLSHLRPQWTSRGKLRGVAEAVCCPVPCENAPVFRKVKVVLDHICQLISTASLHLPMICFFQKYHPLEQTEANISLP